MSVKLVYLQTNPNLKTKHWFELAWQVWKFYSSLTQAPRVNTITRNSFDLILSNPENIYNLKYATDKPLKAYASSSNIEVIATFSAILFISDDRPVSMEKFYVVNEIRSLLGFNTASRYSVLAVGLNVPIRDTGDLAWPCELYAPYIRSVSSEKFPMFNIAPVRLHYNKEIAPARNIFTHIPPAFKDRTKHMLQELLSSGITDEFMDCLFCYAFLAISVVIIHSCFITQVLLKKWLNLWTDRSVPPCW